MFFIDYGNTEEILLPSLAPLDDGYLVFPPQMLRCSFSSEPSNPSREVRGVVYIGKGVWSIEVRVWSI